MCTLVIFQPVSLKEFSNSSDILSFYIFTSPSLMPADWERPRGNATLFALHFDKGGRVFNGSSLQASRGG